MMKRPKKSGSRLWKRTCNLAGIFLLTLCGIMPVYAQQSRTVTGTVVDARGEAITGATVVVKGSTVSALSDGVGRFAIQAGADATLVVSFLGFRTQEIPVGNRADIPVVLTEDAKLLDEVVVVGYGTQKRAYLTGAVSQIGAEELTLAPMQNVSNMLTGKIPGLTSIQKSGKPGDDGTALYVRGLNSFAKDASYPMVIVDGVPRTINDINPNDIESVSVLKDAAAAIYGVRGANGVILITTKTGGDGPAKIAYDGSFAITQNTAMPEYLNATDYMYWHNKARAMDGLTPLWTADIQNKVLRNDPNSIWGETDWLNKVFATGKTQQHNISASGGTQRMKYYTSLGVMDQDGTLKNTGFTRYNVRANLDIQVAKNLRFSANIAGDRTDKDWPGYAIGKQQELDPVRQAISAIPIIKSEYKGLPTAWNGGGLYNMNGYAGLFESGFKRQTNWHLNSNFKLEYDFSGLTDILKGLKASMFAAYNYSNTADSNYDRSFKLYAINANFDEEIVNASGINIESAYTKSASWGDTWMVRPQIEYSREFGKHYVGALLFYEAQKTYSNTMTGRKTGYYSDDPVDLSLGSTFTVDAATKNYPVTGSYQYTGQASYAGRFNYAYDKKYLAEVAFRYDGSYVFAPENRWGFFPSASLGWVVSQEEFFAALTPVVDYFKIRFSYGQSGSDVVDPFLYNSTYALSVNSMVLGGEPISQFYTENPYIYRNLTWATTHSYNLGLDVDLWNKKLGIELDIFYKLTEDILEDQGGNFPPSLASYFPTKQNSGMVDNRGFEITLKHDNRINSDWSYALSGSFSFARNRVLKRALTDNYPNYRAQLGESSYAKYGFIALGLFQSQEEIDQYPQAPSGDLRPGDIKYLDVNGDGIISDKYDYMKMGYGEIPEINFSLNMSVSWKNFYATLLWQGVTHCDYELSGVYDTEVISSTNYTSPFAENGNSPYYLIEDAWTPENPNAAYPRLSTRPSGNNAWQSTWWLINGEYLRLKNANIGYNVPEKYLRKTPFTRINVYLAGTNLLTFSHFKYVDPEAPSVSRGNYPQQQTFSIGLNVTF
jgi:TonB-linked SusC/RagA family outer membrane protein